MNISGVVLIVGLFLTSCLSCSPKNDENKEDGATETTASNLIPYTLITTLVHDKEAYTQGLVYHEGKLYESTGGDQSWIAEVDILSGKQDKKVVLDQKYFGEGITVLNNKVYQLTWKNKTGFIYSADGFKNRGTFSYDFEGWGITTDGEHLIVSDGTNKIHYLDTLDFNVVKTIKVEERGGSIERINELEYINDYIYANQWETNYILKIDPQTGQVVGKIDLSPIANEIKRTYPDANVLNGIAYNPESKDILVTGKLWPRAYVLRLQQY